MFERAAAEVSVERRRVQGEEIVHGVDCGVRRFSVDWWYRGFFEGLDKLINRGDRNGGKGMK